MVRNKLWYLYFFRVFRISFREPTTRGIGLINLLGFVLGSFAILIVISTMGGFFQSVHLAVSSFAGDLSVLTYQAVQPDQRDRIIQTLQERYGDQALIFDTSAVLIQFRGQNQDALLEASPSDMNLNLPQAMTSCLRHAQSPAVVLGTPMRDHFQVREGDVIKIFSPQASGVRHIQAKVCGFTSVGFYEYDKRLVWVDQRFIQSWIGQVSLGAKIHLSDKTLEFLNSEKHKLQMIFEQSASVFTWYDRNENLFEAIQTERNLVLWVIAFIILVASFNLISHLYVHYHQREDVFRLLYVLGEKRLRILKLCLSQGAMVGLVGSTLGALIAWAVILITKTVLPIPIPVEVYNLSVLPFQFEPWAALVVIGASGFISMLVSLIPALQTFGLFRLQPQGMKK